MNRTLTAAALLVSLTGSAFAQDSQSFDRVERGRYLAVLGDCVGCHTSKGGAPFGKLVAPNITPDRDTGIGNMTDDEFVAALHEGRGMGGKRLYPAMPYPAYTKMSRDDALALRSYFNTLQPVNNAVVSNQLPFPFNIRLAMLGWNWLNFKPARFEPNPQKSAEWNRGAYIVEGPAHCGTCHTPKTALGGDKTSTPLAGGTLQGWLAPNITPDGHTGVGAWSKDDLTQYLKTGVNSFTMASGPMAEAVTHSTSQMTDADLAAIATYLKDSGTGSNPAKPAPLATSDAAMRMGAAIYKDNCAACHKDAGTGDRALFPKLAGSTLVQQADPTTLAHVVLSGSRAVATDGAPTAPAMPPFDWRLNDAQVGAVLTYIRNSWGNAAAAVPASAVADQRASKARFD